MKRLNIMTALLWSSVFFSMVHPAVASDKVKTFEMGESGQIVTFPMTAQEIAAEKAMNSNPSSKAYTIDRPAKKQVTAIEMGESGQVVIFPSTPEEVLAHKIEGQRRSAYSSENNVKAADHVVVHEMGESGQVVSFPKKSKKIAFDENKITANRSVTMEEKN